MEKKKYDFFDIGSKYADVNAKDVEKRIGEIFKSFKSKAAKDFISGYLAYVPAYCDTYFLYKLDDGSEVKSKIQSNIEQGKTPDLHGIKKEQKPFHYDSYPAEIEAFKGKPYKIQVEIKAKNDAPKR